jgi:micrococcal nuclease
MKKNKLLALFLSLGLIFGPVNSAFASESEDIDAIDIESTESTENLETKDLEKEEEVESIDQEDLEEDIQDDVKEEELSKETKAKIEELKNAIDKNIIQARAAEMLLDKYPNSVKKVRNEIIDLLKTSQSLIIKSRGVITKLTGEEFSNDDLIDLSKYEKEPIVESSKYVSAKVVNVVDGDTIDVIIGIDQKYRVRLIGVDTPETVHPNKDVEYFGKEASDYTKNKLTGKTVYLEKDVSEVDKYGRLLRYVWLTPPSEDPSEKEIRANMFNAILVANGYANAATFPPDVKYTNLFLKLAEEAKNKGLGLWAENNDKDDDKNQEENQDNTQQYPQGTGTIKANVKSGIYHLPGQRYYDKISEKNIIYFETEEEAIKAGFRRSKV